MSISEPFIRRPVATSLLMVALVLVGFLAFRDLPIAPLPQVDHPTLVVSTALPGASADTMAASVTTPLERQLGQIPGLAQMTSLSSAGTSQITLQFSLERPLGAAEQDVQAALNGASTLLPRTLPSPPTYSRSNPADTPILTLAVSSSVLSLAAVDDAADSILAQKISQVVGVGLVTLNGRQKPAVRVQVDPQSLAGANLTLEDVRAALAAANVHQPTGSLDGPRQNYTLLTNDQLGDARGFRDVVLAWRNGAPVRLREVGDARDGVENDQLAGWADGRRAILVNVQRQPGANILDVATRVKALLPRLQASLPQGVEVRVVSDRTETIRASVDDVEFTLVLTIGLVVAVIWLFLRDLRATVIPGVAVPLSLVGTFAVMWALGYSLNNLSLMALTIATGFVVDDAIVVTENIARFIEHGDPPFEAALKGAKQIGFTIVSLTVSLVAVLIPLLFMGGLIGRLFREFAVTLAAAIGVSALLSLTLTPMMAAHLLRPVDAHARPGFVHRVVEGAWTWLVERYDRGLRVVLRHRGLTLLAAALTVAVTAALAVAIPKGFFPQQDTGLVVGVTEAAPDVSFERMASLQERVDAVVRADDAVASVVSFIGPDGTNATANTGRLSIALKPREHRRDDAGAVVARLQRALADVEGVAVYLQAAQDLQVDTRLARTQFQYTLEDADPDELDTWTPRFLDALRGLRDVTSDRGGDGLAVAVDVDRDTASRLGVDAQTLDDTLYDAFGQRQASLIFTQLNQYRVLVELAPAQRRDPRALASLYVRTRDGGLVPLSAFCRFRERPARLSVSHQGQFPSVTVSFNLPHGGSLGDAVAVVDAAVARIGMPPTVRGQFQGAAQAFRESLATQPALLAAAIVAVYIVLGVLYESLVHPLTILSTLPSAGVGALAALMLTGTDFSVIALIGVVLLIGIVKKNAIMMIDFALEAERDQGMSPEEAIHQACLLRFRPIMMTTLAALLGALPLALGHGTGSELRRPLGVSIVGGLLLSQVLTLYTTPVIYLALDGLRARLTRRAAPVAERAP